jgi:diacylglycerol kinase (ATP)
MNITDPTQNPSNTIPPMFKKVQVIANPAAGAGDTVLATLNRAFREHDVDWDIRITHQAGDGARLAREAAAAGTDLVVSYGGDGTIGDIVNGLYGTDVPLAVLMGGTGNGAAGALNVPTDLYTAALQIAQGHGDLRPIDLGKIGERVFLLRVDIGDAMHVIGVQESEVKQQFGALAYLYGIANAMAQSENILFKLTVDGEAHECQGVACMMANLNNIGSFNVKLQHGIAPDDGQISVFIVKNNLGSVTSLVANLTGWEAFQDMFYHYKGQRITVETPKPHPVLVDGEALLETPVQVESLHNAIRVFMPHTS